MPPTRALPPRGRSPNALPQPGDLRVNEIVVRPDASGDHLCHLAVEVLMLTSQVFDVRGARVKSL